jgi:hypothetical protein
LTGEIADKNVLIVNDLVERGDIEWRKNSRHSRAKGSWNWSFVHEGPDLVFDPDYYWEVADGRVVFPFEVSEVNRLRIANGDVSPPNPRALYVAYGRPSV